jgi:hypothetical protein
LEFDMPDGRIDNSHQTFINVWESLGYDPLTSPTDFASGFALAVHPDDQERVRRAIQEFLVSSLLARVAYPRRRICIATPICRNFREPTPAG